jgi:23S rRNA (pseudouridine1915-N3)-methyltransferase
MRLTVVAIGQRMPTWITQGWNEYARRFPRGFSLELKEIPAIKRSHNADIESVRRRESESLLLAVPESSYLIALDGGGRQWTTLDLSQSLQSWMQGGRDVAFLVGGPDGLSTECLAKADRRWSLGALTLPHPLVRIVLAEQLYRAWSITQNHPYHRE